MQPFWAAFFLIEYEKFHIPYCVVISCNCFFSGFETE